MNAPNMLVGNAYAYTIVIAAREGKGQLVPSEEDGLPILMHVLPDLTFRHNWLCGWLRWLRALKRFGKRMPIVVEIHKRSPLFIWALMLEAELLRRIGHETFVCYPDSSMEKKNRLLGIWRKRRPEKCFVGIPGVAQLHAMMKLRSEAHAA